MKQWNFYFSGILYGIIYDEIGDGTILSHTPLDSFTGNLTDVSPFSDDTFYHVLCKRHLLTFFSRLTEYDAAIFRGDESFTTTSGERFTRRLDGSYIQRDMKFPMDLYASDGQIYAVQMAGRDYTGVLVLNGRQQDTILRKWSAVYPSDSAIHAVSPPQTYMVPTRDGQSLATDVYLPNGISGPIPSLLIRTPYGKRDGAELYYRFVQRGYAVIIQDTRGREDSTGEWLPNYYEVEDGDDTLNWIAAKSFSDGQAAMAGGSYLGYVQWAAAASGNPHLKAILSCVCAGSPFIDLPRRGGCFCSGSMAWNFAMTRQRFSGDLMERDDWDEVLDIRPISDIPVKALGHSIPFLDKWLEHPDYDEFWKKGNWRERSCGHVVPALIMSGWFDDNGMGTTEALELVNEYYPPHTFKAILGPWKHSGNADYDLHHNFMGDNALRYDMDFLCFQWLEHFLKGVDNKIEESATVEYYTLGDNCWKQADRWPVEYGVKKTFYLSQAEEVSNRTNQASDNYCYDPEFPAIHIIDVSENELEVPENYTEEEKRADVLCYSTGILSEDVTITGDATVTLYVSSDCPDTDFIVRLTDVDENGTSIKLADGVLSAKYRNGFEKPEFMEAGQVYELNIRTTKLSNTFKKGHQIRLTVTSGAKNFVFPNSNTVDGFDSRIKKTACNTIYHNEMYPSRVVFFVENGADWGS